MAVKKKKTAARPVPRSTPRKGAKTGLDAAKSYFKQAETRVRRVKVEKFATDAWHTMLNPVKYFAGIKADGNYENTIVKVLIYGLIAAGIKVLLGLPSITLVSALTSAVLFSVYAVLLTFGLGGVLLFFSYIAKGEMNFETAVKAVASCIFMYPLAYAAYHLAFAWWVLFFLSLAIDLYIVFLIYTAVIYCLKAEGGVSRIIFGIFAAFVVALHFSAPGIRYVANKNPAVGFEHTLSQYNKGKLAF